MKIYNDDCDTILKLLDENSVDAIVSDPPYGLKFMGKKWDYDVPSVEIWKSVLRVIKPGGHVLIACGTRTQHRMAQRIEDAGFEIRDIVSWIYGSGFPKSHNLKGKWQGWGTALKPAQELWTLARKPLIGTVAENVEKFGTGGLNIDGTRIEAGSDLKPVFSGAKGSKQSDYGNGTVFGNSDKYESVVSPQGRWPANVIFDEEAAAMLDEQSGTLVSRWGKRNQEDTGDSSMFGIGAKGNAEQFIGDKGGASRFFYCAKASKRERNEGLESLESQTTSDGRDKSIDNPFLRGETLRQNSHPTVKPIKLMEYLIKLITPPNGLVLDPFMGSGSTGVAAERLGFKFIGIEIDEKYCEIAKRRIEHAKADLQMDLEEPA